jgi:hypothetical protein
MRISRFIQNNGNYFLYLIQQIGGKSQKGCGIRRDTPRQAQPGGAELSTGSHIAEAHAAS